MQRLLLAALLTLGTAMTVHAQDARRFAKADGEFPGQILLDSPTGRCSANVISNEGHVLTARHCLMRCLNQSGVFKFKRDSSGFDILVLDSSRLGKATCELQIDGKTATATVVATSPGFISAMEENSFRILDRERFEKFVDQGYTSRGDFAILQFPSLAGKLPCRSLTREKAQAGDAVYSAGFPVATTRPDGNNSDGIGKFKTSGQILSSITQNQCYQEWVNTVSPKVAAEREKSLIRDFDEPGSFVSDIDAIYGASGSGLWNQRGDIVGVLTNTYRHTSTTRLDSDEPEMRYCAGSTLAISSARIYELLETLPEPAGKASWDEALLCRP